MYYMSSGILAPPRPNTDLATPLATPLLQLETSLAIAGAVFVHDQARSISHRPTIR